MTLPPHKIGDNGQRYEVRYLERGLDYHKVVGWSGDLVGASKMRDAWKQHPSSERVWVYDRTENKEVD